MFLPNWQYNIYLNLSGHVPTVEAKRHLFKVLVCALFWGFRFIPLLLSLIIRQFILMPFDHVLQVLSRITIYLFNKQRLPTKYLSE